MGNGLLTEVIFTLATGSSVAILGCMTSAGFSSTESLSGIYILVVDGDAERRALVVGILRYCGALVTPADSPAAALTVIELLKPDLIVVDFSRPDGGGLTFIRRLRALKPEQGGTIRVIAVGDSDANAELALGRGFDAYLTTPLESWELCRRIATLLNG